MRKLPPLKRFGQNFLQDQEVLQDILDAAELSKEDEVLEIGMGRGILTEALAKRVKRVTVCEIDKKLFAQISAELGKKYDNIEFVEGDFLQLSDKLWKNLPAKVKVIANIPYNITTPILESLVVYKEKIAKIVIMVQKEVAERLQAKPGCKDYGALTLFIQFHMEAKLLRIVPKQCFSPQPKVDSAIVQLTPLAGPPVDVVSQEKYFKVIKGSFWGRRKTLRNALKQSPFTYYSNEMLKKIEQQTGIDLVRRGETLSMQEFANITNTLFQK